MLKKKFRVRKFHSEDFTHLSEVVEEVACSNEMDARAQVNEAIAADNDIPRSISFNDLFFTVE